MEAKRPRSESYVKRAEEEAEADARLRNPFATQLVTHKVAKHATAASVKS